uniref:Uncharacterized protein n=1 Tax=Loa loa TaxID=7209 RepID=A0A1I7VIK7_LOALO
MIGDNGGEAERVSADRRRGQWATARRKRGKVYWHKVGYHIVGGGADRSTKCLSPRLFVCISFGMCLCGGVSAMDRGSLAPRLLYPHHSSYLSCHLHVTNVGWEPANSDGRKERTDGDKLRLHMCSSRAIGVSVVIGTEHYAAFTEGAWPKGDVCRIYYVFSSCFVD